MIYDVCSLVPDPDSVTEIPQCSEADSTIHVTEFDEIVGRKSQKLIFKGDNNRQSAAINHHTIKSQSNSLVCLKSLRLGADDVFLTEKNRHNSQNSMARIQERPQLSRIWSVCTLRSLLRLIHVQ